MDGLHFVDNVHEYVRNKGVAEKLLNGYIRTLNRFVVIWKYLSLEPIFNLPSILI